MIAKMRNLGEACTAANRIYVHQAIEADFVEKYTARMAGLKMGDGLDPSVDVGPLINAETRDKVAAFVDDALARGAELKLGVSGQTRLGFITHPPYWPMCPMTQTV
jgi:succinate-semialdehyde dehydrogenase/glutarate-semialdehyde dehydrogenase